MWFIWPLVTSQDSQDMLTCLLPLICEGNLPSWLGSWSVSCHESWLAFDQGLIWITPTSWTGMVHAHKIMYGEIAQMYKHMLYIYVHLRSIIPLFVHYGEVSICKLSCWSNFLFGSVWKLGIPHNGHQKIGKMNENDSIFSDKPWQSHFRVSQ